MASFTVHPFTRACFDFAPHLSDIGCIFPYLVGSNVQNSRMEKRNARADDKIFDYVEPEQILLRQMKLSLAFTTSDQ